MPDCGWSQDLNSGARRLDAANESLFFLVNNLFKPGVECKRRHGYCPRDGCSKVAAVVRFLTRNQAAEETLMAESAYPDGAAHCLAHRNMLAAMQSLLDAQLCGDEDHDEDKVRSAISDWATDHVLRHDKPLGEWLSRPAAQPGSAVNPSTSA
jgi:hemerythrin-like metal-binding protein